jgi:ATP-dependent DNA helicase RecG
VNPFLARPFYLAGYINQLGYGTRNVVKWCRKAGLPDPKFDPAENHFRVIIWRDWLTDSRMKGLDLNERQVKAVQFLKSDLRITNTEYQKLNSVSRATAKRDLDELVKLGLLKLKGAGRSAHYRLTGNRLKNGSNGFADDKIENGS